MTMMQKVQAKRSKKGFTLVELVIVIAILAILAAIAIPVITTTINSAKISTMQSDAATCGMLVKEAVNNRLANIESTTYAGVEATDESLTVQTVLAANDIDTAKYVKTDGSTFYSRKVGAKTYVIGYKTDGGVLSIGCDTSDKYEHVLDDGTTIKDLADATQN